MFFCDLTMAFFHTSDIDIESQEDFFEEFNCKEECVLGSGAFGTVFLVVSNADPSVRMAVKKISLNGTNAKNSEFEEDLQNEKMFMREIKVMKSINHPSIMALIASVRTPSYLALVLPYCCNGTLMESIKNLCQSQQIKYIRQLCQAVQYLHNKNIIHGDIKPNNILLDEDKNLLLSDFGFSRSLPNKTVDIFIDYGTKAYRAPETFGDERVNPFKVDMYAVGVTIWAILLRKRPWHKLNYIKILGNVLHMHPTYRKILRLLLDFDPNIRPSATEILEEI